MTARSPPADRAAPPSFFGRPPPSECAACTPPCTSAAAASPPPARPPPLPPPRLARPWGHPVSPSSVISGVGTVSLILAQRELRVLAVVVGDSEVPPPQAMPEATRATTKGRASSAACSRLVRGLVGRPSAADRTARQLKGHETGSKHQEDPAGCVEIDDQPADQAEGGHQPQNSHESHLPQVPCLAL